MLSSRNSQYLNFTPVSITKRIGAGVFLCPGQCELFYRLITLAPGMIFNNLETACHFRRLSGKLVQSVHRTKTSVMPCADSPETLAIISMLRTISSLVVDCSSVAV